MSAVGRLTALFFIAGRKVKKSCMKIGIDLLIILITVLFVLGGAYLGAMRSIIKIFSFFGSALMALFLFPLLQKTELYQIATLQMEEFLVQKGITVFSDQAAGFLCSILLALGLYFGSKLLLLLLSTVLEGVVRLPGLKQVNRMTGALIGLAEAAVLIFSILAVFRLIARESGELPFYSYLEQSILAQRLYEYNPLMIFFQGK